MYGAHHTCSIRANGCERGLMTLWHSEESAVRWLGAYSKAQQLQSNLRKADASVVSSDSPNRNKVWPDVDCVYPGPCGDSLSARLAFQVLPSKYVMATAGHWHMQRPCLSLLWSFRRVVEFTYCYESLISTAGYFRNYMRS